MHQKKSGEHPHPANPQKLGSINVQLIGDGMTTQKVMIMLLVMGHQLAYIQSSFFWVLPQDPTLMKVPKGVLRC